MFCQYTAGTRRRGRPGRGPGRSSGYVEEDSGQRAGNRIRVTVELIDARADALKWAEHYGRDLADVFAIQSKIVVAIADQLQAKISPREEAATERLPTASVAAYDLYTYWSCSCSGMRCEAIRAPRPSSLRSRRSLADEASVGARYEAVIDKTATPDASRRSKKRRAPSGKFVCKLVLTQARPVW